MIVPKNPLLYNSILRMEKAKHHAVNGTNFAVSKDMPSMYLGGFVNVSSMDELDPKLRDYKEEEKDKEKRKAAELKRDKKKKNLL
ncbi:hypothetical protein UFOVP621_50 [uncultured Caudovirales phage]|uniref:Uncharacterized protein n=1 Tax=uncultured Caudovirales phage TaxID=2100421 RepID=A0A6J5N753_9CAUD|nr:hypothetical protein UFOVP621_50 [uncultured Caudovirales phage]